MISQNFRHRTALLSAQASTNVVPVQHIRSATIGLRRADGPVARGSDCRGRCPSKRKAPCPLCAAVHGAGDHLVRFPETSGCPLQQASPPSTGRLTPVMNDASSEAKKAM